jgi:hypothetical protein
VLYCNPVTGRVHVSWDYDVNSIMKYFILLFCVIKYFQVLFLLNCYDECLSYINLRVFRIPIL